MFIQFLVFVKFHHFSRPPVFSPSFKIEKGSCRFKSLPQLAGHNNKNPSGYSRTGRDAYPCESYIVFRFLFPMRCSWICKLNITKFWNKSETKHVYNTRGKYSTLNKAMLCEVLPTYVIRVLSSASPIDFLNSDDEKLATGQVCRILRRNEPQLTKQLKLLNHKFSKPCSGTSRYHTI